jgi:hypothetical protein
VRGLALAALVHAESQDARRITTQPGRPTALPQPGSAIGSWPSFCGPNASGIADHQNLPDQWSLETGQNILWRIPVPGLAHSSPIVWGNRIFLTTAISSRDDARFVPGVYGAGTPSDDRTPHRWVVYCIDKTTGRTIWERTDGRIVVGWFGGGRGRAAVSACVQRPSLGHERHGRARRRTVAAEDCRRRDRRHADRIQRGCRRRTHGHACRAATRSVAPMIVVKVVSG